MFNSPARLTVVVVVAVTVSVSVAITTDGVTVMVARVVVVTWNELVETDVKVLVKVGMSPAPVYAYTP